MATGSGGIGKNPFIQGNKSSDNDKADTKKGSKSLKKAVSGLFRKQEQTPNPIKKTQVLLPRSKEQNVAQGILPSPSLSKSSINVPRPPSLGVPPKLENLHNGLYRTVEGQTRVYYKDDVKLRSESVTMLIDKVILEDGSHIFYNTDGQEVKYFAIMEELNFPDDLPPSLPSYKPVPFVPHELPIESEMPIVQDEVIQAQDELEEPPVPQNAIHMSDPGEDAHAVVKENLLANGYTYIEDANFYINDDGDIIDADQFNAKVDEYIGNHSPDQLEQQPLPQNPIPMNDPREDARAVVKENLLASGYRYIEGAEFYANDDGDVIDADQFNAKVDEYIGNNSEELNPFLQPHEPNPFAADQGMNPFLGPNPFAAPLRIISEAEAKTERRIAQDGYAYDPSTQGYICINPLLNYAPISKQDFENLVARKFGHDES